MHIKFITCALLIPLQLVAMDPNPSPNNSPRQNSLSGIRLTKSNAHERVSERNHHPNTDHPDDIHYNIEEESSISLPSNSFIDELKSIDDFFNIEEHYGGLSPALALLDLHPLKQFSGRFKPNSLNLIEIMGFLVVCMYPPRGLSFLKKKGPLKLDLLSACNARHRYLACLNRSERNEIFKMALLPHIKLPDELQEYLNQFLDSSNSLEESDKSRIKLRKALEQETGTRRNKPGILSGFRNEIQLPYEKFIRFCPVRELLDQRMEKLIKHIGNLAQGIHSCGRGDMVIKDFIRILSVKYEKITEDYVKVISSILRLSAAFIELFDLMRYHQSVYPYNYFYERFLDGAQLFQDKVWLELSMKKLRGHWQDENIRGIVEHLNRLSLNPIASVNSISYNDAPTLQEQERLKTIHNLLAAEGYANLLVQCETKLKGYNFPDNKDFLLAKSECISEIFISEEHRIDEKAQHELRVFDYLNYYESLKNSFKGLLEISPTPSAALQKIIAITRSASTLGLASYLHAEILKYLNKEISLLLPNVQAESLTPTPHEMLWISELEILEKAKLISKVGQQMALETWIISSYYRLRAIFKRLRGYLKDNYQKSECELRVGACVSDFDRETRVHAERGFLNKYKELTQNLEGQVGFDNLHQQSFNILKSLPVSFIAQESVEIHAICSEARHYIAASEKISGIDFLYESYLEIIRVITNPSMSVQEISYLLWSIRSAFDARKERLGRQCQCPEINYFLAAMESEFDARTERIRSKIKENSLSHEEENNQTSQETNKKD